MMPIAGNFGMPQVFRYPDGSQASDTGPCGKAEFTGNSGWLLGWPDFEARHAQLVQKPRGPLEVRAGCFSCRLDRFSHVGCRHGSDNNEGFRGHTAELTEAETWIPHPKTPHLTPSETLERHQPLILWLAGDSVSRETRGGAGPIWDCSLPILQGRPVTAKVPGP